MTLFDLVAGRDNAALGRAIADDPAAAAARNAEGTSLLAIRLDRATASPSRADLAD